MSACHEIQKLLPISPGDVPPEEYRRITNHLDSCPECSRWQEQLSALEDASAEIEVPDPGDQYWESFADRVRRHAGVPEGVPQRSTMRQLIFRPAFGWPAAAAALILVFFIGRAVIHHGDVPPPQPGMQHAELSGRAAEPMGPEAGLKSPEGEIATIQPRSEPGAPVAEQTESPQQVVDTQSAMEQLARASSTQASEGTIQPQEAEPRTITEPGSPGALTMGESGTEEESLPGRQTIILRGDTDEAQLSDQGLPSGKDLASVERPNAPLPMSDTLTPTEAERILGAPGAQEYVGADSQTASLNRNGFTEEGRNQIKSQIADLTREVNEKKGSNREKACRELVNLYYQLAVHWQVQSDIRGAVAFMDEARGILPQEDLPDLTSKEAVLKSMLDESSR
jgi:hypothetical protein